MIRVIKLGGSLSRSPHLPRWLQHAHVDRDGPCAIVPGGGEFADTARAAQAHWHFDDLHAHNMAVLGMAQFAEVLHALEPALSIASDIPTLATHLAAGRSAIWRPLDLLRARPDALTNWSVTSDSLALWLAGQLGAERLTLVKACPIPEHTGWDELARQGVVDKAFAGMTEMHAGVVIDIITAYAASHETSTL